MSICPLLMLVLAAALSQPAHVETCGFEGYSRFKLTDFVENAVLSKKAPKYPEESKGLGLGGRVYIRILVNQEGKVERVCPDLRMSSTSAKRLVKAAADAASQWTFKPNFGFPKVPKTLKGRFLEDIIGFDFKPKLEISEQADGPP